MNSQQCVQKEGAVEIRRYVFPDVKHPVTLESCVESHLAVAKITFFIEDNKNYSGSLSQARNVIQNLMLPLRRDGYEIKSIRYMDFKNSDGCDVCKDEKLNVLMAKEGKYIAIEFIYKCLVH